MTSSDLKHLYDERYFTENVDGAGSWADFDGTVSSLVAPHRWVVERINPYRGQRILDLGCGRGEVAMVCAAHGAEVVGADFSEVAVRMAGDKARELGVDVDFRLADVAALRGRGPYFDAVVMTEVVEHISPAELGRALDLALDVLKPGGVLLVYSHPNTWRRRIGWPLIRAWNALRGRALPRMESDQMDAHYYRVHINEMGPLALWWHLWSAGFSPLVRVGWPWERGMRHRWPFSWLFSHGLNAVATKPRFL